MSTPRRRFLRHLYLLLLVPLLCSACGDNATNSGGATTPTACTYGDGSRANPLLEETCVAYQEWHLFPEELPTTLDGILDPEGYVARVREADPFTVYYDAEAYSQLLQPVLGGQRSYVGVVLGIGSSGEVITTDTPLLVLEVLPFTRAWFDGLQVDDQIVAIANPDGSGQQSLAGLGLDDARALFPQTEGEEKQFMVRRGQDLVTLLSGAQEHIGLLMEPSIGYLSVRRFTEVTGLRVQEELDALHTRVGGNLHGVILDLRNNPGGSVSGALASADYLIDLELTSAGPHPLLTFADRDGGTEQRYLGTYSDANYGELDTANCVVLIDGGSASAAEIVIAALRDYGTCTLLGSTTFGKGVRQKVREISDGAALAITSDFILAPSGETYHEVAIAPDLQVADEPLAPEQDPALTAALTWIAGGDAASFSPPRPTRKPAEIPTPPDKLPTRHHY